MERSLAGLIIAAFMLACGWKVRRKALQLGVFVGNDAAEKRAKELGANAVVNIVSYYQKNVVSSAQNSSVMPAQ